MSKSGSKKRANTAKKKKGKTGARRRRKREPVAAALVAPGERAKGLNLSKSWTEEAKREAVALLERGDVMYKSEVDLTDAGVGHSIVS